MKTYFWVLMAIFTFGGKTQAQDQPPYKYDEAKLTTTPSGLKYVIVEEGKGPRPVGNDRVSVHYHGLLTDGKKFDSSFDRGQPFDFALGTGQVIKGWDEGIAYLPEGSKAVLVIPPQLGYGSQNMGSIPPNSTLIFHVHLVKVVPAPKPIAFSPPKIDESKLITTPSGLKYQIFEMGKGPKVNPGENVKVHYHGMLDDGKVFDSSYRRGEPIQFPLGVGRVIKGWDEGIALMPKGSKGVLIVPAELGYGSRDMGTIPPNSTLTFFVEVVE